ncbi:MAG TPA: ABC transporter permease subunit [Stellaceae bacterium]|nr:ABC transporter permease subunit [Stellaceae bacterium]
MPVQSLRGGDVWLRGLSAAGLLALWQAAAGLASAPQLLPGPAAVAAALARLVAGGQLPLDLAITLLRVAASFALALAAGAAIGIAMGRSRRVDALFDLWLVLGLNIPALVIIYLCYLWGGLTEAAAILAVALNKVPNTATILREGARAVDRELLQVADVLHLSAMRRLRQVYLPQLYPYLMAATRSGLSLIWKIVLVAEFVGRSNGVGFRLNLYFQFFDITNILAYSASFIAVVLAVEAWAIRPLERRLTRWRG